MQGKWVCHYGKTTNQSCGEIFSTSFNDPWTVRGDRKIAVTSSTLMMCGGDSGGPLFMGSTAYGIASQEYGLSQCYSRGDTGLFTAFKAGLDQLHGGFRNLQLLTHY